MDASSCCTCPHYQAVGSSACGFCGGSLPPEWPVSELRLSELAWSFRDTLRVAIAGLVGAFVGLFVVGGALIGATVGAVAGWASNRGILRGSVLGATAGTVLSLEIMEALRAYWCLEQIGAREPASVADLIQELIRVRFVEGHLEPPGLLSAHSQQVNIETQRYSDTDDVYEKFQRGLSRDSLKKLPHHVILETAKQNECCTICLQNIDVGETARRLPHCHHMFHLTCVDKWLIIQGSCPVCRQVLQV